MVIAQMVIQIFLSCPSDMDEEERVLKEVVDELNLAWSKHLGTRLSLLNWKTDAYPGVGADPQTVINDAIGDDFDIFIGVMGDRFGTPTPRAGSGTAEEFERAYARHKDDPTQVKILFYFKDTPKAPSEVDPSQLAAVQKFKKRIGEKGTLYWSYRTLHEFASLLRLHLAKQAQEYKSSLETGKVRVHAVPAGATSVYPEEKAPSICVAKVVEEEGFLDLIEQSIDGLKRGNTIADRIAEDILDLGEKLGQRSAQLQRIAADPHAINRKSAKQVVNLAARDMDKFCDQIEASIPQFAEAFETGLVSGTRAVALLVDFETYDRTEIQGILDSMQTMLEGVGGAKEGVIALQTSTESLPRVTTRLNIAKRRTSAVLQRLAKELDHIEVFVVEVQTTAREFLDTAG